MIDKQIFGKCVLDKIWASIVLTAFLVLNKLLTFYIIMLNITYDN